MSSKANTKATKAQKNATAVPVPVPVPVPVSAPVPVPAPAPAPEPVPDTTVAKTDKPKATRAKAPADPNKPKVKPLEMKYKTMLAGMLWLLDESRLRKMFDDLAESDDPNQLEQDELDIMIEAAPLFRRGLKILESDTDKRQLLQTIDIKHVYKTHVSSVVAEHKKAETRRRNEEKKRIKQAEIKAAKENGTHAPRAKRAPKAKIIVPAVPEPVPEPIMAPVYTTEPIDFGDEDDDSEYVDAHDESEDERMNMDFDAEVARSMVAPPVADDYDDDTTQMMSGNESDVRIPIPVEPPAKKGRGRIAKTKVVDTKASDTDEPVDKPLKPVTRRGRKAIMV